MTTSYFNGKADVWDEQVAEKDHARLQRMADNLDIQPGSTVLDVGTGTGVFVPFLLRKIAPQGKLVCLDYAERMIEKARSKKFEGQIDYVCSDIHTTDFRDGAFDAVVCYSSFPHFQDKLKAFKEMQRILKKGGKLFICHTSSRAVINGIHQNIPEVSQDLIPEKDEMLSLLSSAGFENIELRDEASSYFVRADRT